MSKNRFETFTDAVLAIIMTIMALEIHVPSEPTFQAFTKLLIPLLAYFISFFGLTNLWIAHHRVLKTANKISYRSVFINAILLFWVTMVPVSTAWVADYPTKNFPQQVFIFVQLGWFFFMYILIRSIQKDNQQKTTNFIFNKATLINIALMIILLVFPVPYWSLFIALIIIITTPILLIREEKNSK